VSREAALARLADAGFVVSERAGRTWLRFPDGNDSEIVPCDAPIDAEALIALAHQREATIARVVDVIGGAGWGLARHPGGKWSAGKDGTVTMGLDVGWLLTERLRDADVETVAREWIQPWLWYFGPADPLAAPPRSPPPDTDASWQSHLRERARMFGEDDEDEADDDEAPAPRSPGAVGREKRAAAEAAAGALDDAAMDRWSDAMLATLRRDAAKRHGLWQLLDPPWRLGDDDWLDYAGFLAACEDGLADGAWNVPALRGLLAAGVPGARERALAVWDDWKAEGGYDGDSFGFTDLAAWLHRDRPEARALLFDDDDVSQAGRVFRAGFANALHAIRVAIEGCLGEWAAATTPREERRAVVNAIEALYYAGADAARAVLDADEAARLRASCATLVREMDADTSDRVFLEWILEVAVHCGWPDVALALLDEDRNSFLLGNFDNYYWETPYLAEGLLALSALAPGGECATLARLAQARMRRRREHGPLKDPDAIAIAWWRCRRAMR
jgi:hypothetical protein